MLLLEGYGVLEVLGSLHMAPSLNSSQVSLKTNWASVSRHRVQSDCIGVLGDQSFGLTLSLMSLQEYSAVTLAALRKTPKSYS